jgi:hypothetical protein
MLHGHGCLQNGDPCSTASIRKVLRRSVILTVDIRNAAKERIDQWRTQKAKGDTNKPGAASLSWLLCVVPGEEPIADGDTPWLVSMPVSRDETCMQLFTLPVRAGALLSLRCGSIACKEAGGYMHMCGW